MKRCPRCLETKSLDLFSPDNRTRSGVQSRCRPCQAEIARERYASNPERHRESVRGFAKRNPDEIRERNRRYRKANPEKISEWKRLDRTRNKARILADNAQRRTLLRSGNHPEIKMMYALRDFYEAMSIGEKFHVDHIVPLSRGGKHEANNLQVIPAIDNLRKSDAVNESQQG